MKLEAVLEMVSGTVRPTIRNGLPTRAQRMALEQWTARDRAARADRAYLESVSADLAGLLPDGARRDGGA